MFDTLEELKTAMGVAPEGPPYEPQTNEVDPFTPGPYLTFADYYSLVHYGAIGPDELTYWVYISLDGNLIERLIQNPYEERPANTICVAYYAA